jgi:hypothetical protein
LDESASRSAWWGEFDVDEGATRFWQIGPWRMWIARSKREWRVTYERHPDALESTLVLSEESPPEAPAGAKQVRFGFRETQASIHLAPRLPDRALVVNPENPFALPPGEEVTIYCGCPLWIHASTGDPAVELFEEAIFRPSETWFGPDPTSGELCYAARATPRLQLQDLPHRPHRAVSPVRIRNRAKSALEVERLKLPMPNLALFASTDGRLWTEAVGLDRNEDGEFAELRLEKAPPKDVRPVKRVAGAREISDRGHPFRAFRRLRLS